MTAVEAIVFGLLFLAFCVRIVRDYRTNANASISLLNRHRVGYPEEIGAATASTAPRHDSTGGSL